MKPLKFRSKGEGRSSFSLNGDWDIAPARDENLPLTFPSTIRVPSVVDCARPGYDWKSAKYHCYRKRFSLEIHPAERAFLKIGQSQFGTNIWVDGNHAGGSISCYTSHEYDITRFLDVGRKEHEIIVRVGRKEDLPKESAVGIDHEKEVYTPGIWGDVSLIACGSPRISVVQMIPDIQSGVFGSKITIENLNTVAATGRLKGALFEKKSGIKASELVEKPFKIAGSGSETVSLDVKIARPNLWSPQDPFLYELHSSVFVDQHRTDELESTCGLREFRIEGRKFLLNEKQIFLKGGNIAFHRFLADQERGILPWDREWIQRVLIDIPKEHQFNFFRNHLGQLYPAWYDTADEGGMLIQNEWHFWGVTGSEEQITKEFTQWLKDNWNHPSIIIWDALNECSDEVVQKKVVPKMKSLDPTRPWESVDFVEQHPYIYSLGPVMNKERFGFTEGIPELENSKKPVVLNEFNWCWVNKTGEATKLMEGVTERWLGQSGNGGGLLAHQSFLATELVEFFRRMRADAIQPFVYLSNNEGPTAHWFQGSIADLNPKPILAALKNVFSPIGVSIELWDRHFVCGEKRVARIFVLNDEPHPASGILSWGVSAMGGEDLTRESINWAVGPSDYAIIECEFRIPDVPGTYTAVAAIQHSGGSATSKKIVHAVNAPLASEALQRLKIAVLESGTDNVEYFHSQGLNAEPLSGNLTSEFDILVVGEGLVRTRDYDSHRPTVEEFLAEGGSVVVLEPELGLEDTAEVHLTASLKILLTKREDRDKGGYDSYVFPGQASHPIFDGLSAEHFHMFNGGFGGEIVSQHDMETEGPHSVLARCGLHLRVCALIEAVSGRGRILVSRIQTRGRLVGGGGGKGLYERRVDPVAQQYMLNLLSYAATEPGD